MIIIRYLCYEVYFLFKEHAIINISFYWVVDILNDVSRSDEAQ